MRAVAAPRTGSARRAALQAAVFARYGVQAAQALEAQDATAILAACRTD